MSFNEKRAHDLALHFVDKIIEEKRQSTINKAIENNETYVEIHNDIFKEYKNLFDSFLNALNRDYPES